MSINFPLQDSDREKLKATDHASEHKTEQSERKLAPTPVAPNHTVDTIDEILEGLYDDYINALFPNWGKSKAEAKTALKQLIEEAVPSEDTRKHPMPWTDEGIQIGFNACRTQTLEAINTLFGKGE